MIRLGRLGFDRPAVMGVLNVTPDSFSDGGKFVGLDAALRQAESMISDGADVVDIGGESTRPGAEDVGVQEELDRVIPVVEAIAGRFDTAISVDTGKPAVMRSGVAAGASMINDVAALQGEGALDAAVELQQPVCLMHMQGKPRTMQQNPQYENVVAEVTAYLDDRVAQCTAAGLDRSLIAVDPGFGFGKTPAHNVELLANLRQLQAIGCPVLIGISRKSTLGVITGRGIDDRLPASIAAAVLAVAEGAAIVRVHDVAATVDALRITRAVLEAGAT